MAFPAHTQLVENTTKYEIHISDLRTFTSCRRRWAWSSPLKRHLEPMVTPIYFLTGRAVHFALATHYETGEMPQDVFERFMTSAIKEEEDRVGVLWPEEREKMDNNLALGRGMMDSYWRYLKSGGRPDEQWKTVATELSFSVPILTPSGTPSSRIFLAGRFDGIVENVEDGTLWLREYKTSARQPNRNWLELDNQATTYAWAAQQLMGRPIAGVHYRFLIKKTPEKPWRLKNGDLTKAINSQLSTTYELYMDAINELAWGRVAEKFGVTVETIVTVEDPEVHEAFLKRQAVLIEEYRSVLEELAGRGWGEYFVEISVRKTQAELEASAHDLWRIGLEMVRPTTPIYPAPEWLKCQFCPYKAPCILTNAGGNPEVLLENEYRPRVVEDPVDAVAQKIEW